MLILAPRDPVVTGPVVFLAGPIQWPTSWQDEAIALLDEATPGLHVANPRRPLSIDTFTEADYAEQVDWETRWLRRAGAEGVVLFWLARERHHRCERAHAQTTRFELAEWHERARRGEARLAIGIEEGFSGARYIRRRFAQDHPGLVVHTSLADTCRSAAALARGEAQAWMPGTIERVSSSSRTPTGAAE